MNSKKAIIALSIFLTLFSCQTVFGASLEVTYPGLPGAPNINSGADINSYVVYVFYLSVYIAGTLTLVMLLIGGVRYFLSAGNVSKMMDAKSQIYSALIGIGIMLGSYTILYNINPQLVILSVKPPPKLGNYATLVKNDAPDKLQSGIYTEIPIGGIIERIFENKKNPSPSPSPSPSPTILPVDKAFENEENEIPRMQRITNVSENILALSEKLKGANKSLKALSEECSCGQVGLESEFTPIQCSPSPAPTPVGYLKESLAQEESESDSTSDSTGNAENVCPPSSNSKFCDISCNSLKEILDTELVFSVDFEDKANDKLKPTNPGCWSKTKRDFTKGDSSLSAGAFTLPITGTTSLKTIVPEKGYFSFSYKTTARDSSCICGPTKSIFGLLYLCGKDINNTEGLENKFIPTGLELKVEGKLDYVKNSGLDNISSGPLFYSENWKEIKVLAEANTRFSFEFSSSAGDPCFYAEIDNVKFVPYDEENDAPSPAPTPIDGCSCDPCKNSRSQIGQTQKEISDLISGKATIDGKNKYGYDEEIKTNLVEQQSKAKKEIRLIQDEIGKLDRMESFMLECGLSNIITLSEYLDLANEYNKQKWILNTANFWDYIKVKEDWATFYCPVSGTLWEGIDPLKIKVKSDLTQAEIDALKKGTELTSRQLVENYEGLTTYEKYLKEIDVEITSLKNKLVNDKTAKAKDKLSEEDIKNINARLDVLNKRKAEIQEKIKKGQENLSEINAEIAVIEARIAPYKILKTNLSIINPTLLLTYTTYQTFSSGLKTAYKDNPEKLKEIEKSLNALSVPLSAGNPLFLIDKEIAEDESDLASLKVEKEAILSGSEGNTGSQTTGKKAEEVPVAGETFSGGVEVACNREIPMGELIDRSKRVGYKIVERLETLVSLSEELMKKTSDLEILVSQCSSKRCKPVCVGVTTSTTPTPTPNPTETPPATEPETGYSTIPCGWPPNVTYCKLDEKCLPGGAGICLPTIYECGTSDNHITCKYGERCLSTKDGPKCYLSSSPVDSGGGIPSWLSGNNCGNPGGQIYCNADYPYCKKTGLASGTSQDPSDGTENNELSCCDAGSCGNWGNQICLAKNTFCIIGKDAGGKETPDYCASSEERSCGDWGNQICCPKNSGCGLGKDNKPFCGGSATLETWATSSICGEPGYQIKCEQPTKYCSGTSTNPTCTGDPNYQKRTDSVYKEVCAYAFTDLSQYLGNNDINYNLGKQCNGFLSFTGYIQSADDYGPSTVATGGIPRIHNSSNPAVPSSVCTDCCEYPNKACGVISPWTTVNPLNPNKWGDFTAGPCCRPDDTCINPANPAGFPSTCCPSSSVVCGETNNQICCNGNQKCGISSGAPYCIDACTEPPQQSFCDGFNTVTDSRNIIWQDTDMNFGPSDPFNYWWWRGNSTQPANPFWTWSRFSAKGFYAQTTEYYSGGKALMASIKNDKTVSGKSFSPDHTTIAGRFNVKGRGSIQFYYKTSKYYNPSITPLKVACKVDTFKTDYGKSGEEIPLLRDCFPGEIVLEPSTEWKKVEIPVPENTEYDNRLNGLVLFSFNPLPKGSTYVPGSIPNDDCVWVAIDKIEYSGSGSGTCEGKPCPEEEIQNTLNDIIDIVDGKPNSQNSNCESFLPDGTINPDYPGCQKNTMLKEKEGIKDVVDGSYKPSDNKTKAEQIGIKALIKEIVPTIFSDLADVRNSMKSCFYDPNGGKSIVQSCELVRNEVGPDGKLIKNCCYKECYMQDCLASCYMKKDTSYKSCLFSCMADEQTKEDRNASLNNVVGIQNIDSCRHSLNFYCCTEQ